MLKAAATTSQSALRRLGCAHVSGADAQNDAAAEEPVAVEPAAAEPAIPPQDSEAA